MSDTKTPDRRLPSIRIDTFKNRVDGARGLLDMVGHQLEDLHILAYDRHHAGQSQRVAGGDRDYALDTHGDPRARELWHRSALQVLDATEDLSMVLHEVLAFFSPGRLSARRDTTADASNAEVIEALAAATRRRKRGEYQAAALVEQPPVTEPASTANELDLLRAAMRKVAGQVQDLARLTPAERDALRRAVDPNFTRSRARKNQRKVS